MFKNVDAITRNLAVQAAKEIKAEENLSVPFSQMGFGVMANIDGQIVDVGAKSGLTVISNILNVPRVILDAMLTYTGSTNGFLSSIGRNFIHTILTPVLEINSADRKATKRHLIKIRQSAIDIEAKLDNIVPRLKGDKKTISCFERFLDLIIYLDEKINDTKRTRPIAKYSKRLIEKIYEVIEKKSLIIPTG